MIVVWATSGPVFHFSDTWQLVINTGTTVITFLMVFLIQNSQNRDTLAVQIKLDELIRAVEGAHNAMLDLESLEPAQLQAIRERYALLATQAREAMASGRNDTGAVPLEKEHLHAVAGPPQFPPDPPGRGEVPGPG